MLRMSRSILGIVKKTCIKKHFLAGSIQSSGRRFLGFVTTNDGIVVMKLEDCRQLTQGLFGAKSTLFSAKQVVLCVLKQSLRVVEIVSSGTKQLVLFRKMTSEQGTEIRLFCNVHVLNDLRKRLKTRVFAVEGRLARKDTILTRLFVLLFYQSRSRHF